MRLLLFELLLLRAAYARARSRHRLAHQFLDRAEQLLDQLIEESTWDSCG
jgi:exonuclease VII small subunit